VNCDASRRTKDASGCTQEAVDIKSQNNQGPRIEKSGGDGRLKISFYPARIARSLAERTVRGQTANAINRGALHPSMYGVLANFYSIILDCCRSEYPIIVFRKCWLLHTLDLLKGSLASQDGWCRELEIVHVQVIRRDFSCTLYEVQLPT
jgi:hypothetical protein